MAEKSVLTAEDIKVGSIETLIEVASKQRATEYQLGRTGWRDFMFLRNTLKTDDMIEAKWLGQEDWRNTWKKSNGTFDAPDMWKESTYDECVEWSFDVNKLVLTVKMWDGDMLNGYRANERCMWQFRVTQHDTKLFDTLLEPMIMARLARIAADKYEEELNRKHKAAIEKILKGMFE